jgi:hypothetical protein
VNNFLIDNKTMVLTNKEKFNIKYGKPRQASNSLSEIVKLTGISKSILEEVGQRGRNAWSNNIQSVRLKSGKKDPSAPRSQKMTATQWGIARIYSFVMNGKTRKTADRDLWEKHLKQKSKK